MVHLHPVGWLRIASAVLPLPPFCHCQRRSGAAHGPLINAFTRDLRLGTAQKLWAPK